MAKYNKDDIKRLSLMAAEIREKARNRDKACFAEAQNFAQRYLRPIKAKAATALETGANTAARNNDFNKLIADLEEYTGQCFKIMIENIQDQYVSNAEQLYLRGSHSQAFPIFKQYAENNNARAQFCLGRCYAEGNGVAQNSQQAFNWCVKAAAKGDRDAQFYVGWYYRYALDLGDDSPVGDDQDVDYYFKNAAYWFQKSAEQGNADAQFELGYLYHFGLGPTQSKSMATYWYKKAAAQGHEYAKRNLKKMN